MTPGGPVAPAGTPWVRAVLDGKPPAPVVLVLGGFLTSPPLYRPFVRRLRARGATDVVVANVWVTDWLEAAWRGMGVILGRTGRALVEASRRSADLAGGAPVLVVGHSAGGMSARLLTSPEPFCARRLDGSGRIGAIVTLGTPNVVGPDARSRNRAAAEAAAHADRVVPGGAFAPTTGYLAVASRKVTGRREGSLDERRAWAFYRTLAPAPGSAPGSGSALGSSPAPGSGSGTLEGDGLVPLASALLPGVRQLVLDDVAHGHFSRGDWYGSDRAMDRWWPVALATWEAALLARVARRPPAADAPCAGF